MMQDIEFPVTCERRSMGAVEFVTLLNGSNLKRPVRAGAGRFLERAEKLSV
jgi:hypothetical protein